MSSLTLLYQLPGCAVDEVLREENTLIIRAHTTSPSASCPHCQQESSQIHSRHRRCVRDLPISDQAVRVTLEMRRFFCRNPQCPQRTFVERIAQTLPLRVRETTRLRRALQGLGATLGGEAGARLGQQLHLPVSPDMLLRLLRHSDLPAAATPAILGVDDWAWKKRQTYGTILVDLAQHRVVDLLPDRSADSLAAWLQKHPGVQIISRDRGGSYAEGASRGAPEALQVADRFHLLTNLREALEGLMNRAHKHLPKLSLPAPKSHRSVPAQGVSDSTAALPQDLSTVKAEATGVAAALKRSTPIGSPLPVCTVVSQKPLSAAERSKQDRRARRYARYQEILSLHAQGMSLRRIARQIGVGRRTLQRYLSSEAFPEIAQRRKMPSLLDAFEPYLDQRWQAGCHNAVQLYREICEQGYTGARPLVSRWALQMRQMTPKMLAHEETSTAQPGPQAPAPLLTRQRQLSPSQAAWLLLCEPGDLTAEHQAALQQMRQASSEIALAYELAQQFAHMVRQHQAEPLTAWLQSAKNCGLTELRTFASGIQRDLGAVVAGLSLPWSQGQVEGQVNRLKLIKRSMFGRAKFDLLRQRVLAPS